MRRIATMAVLLGALTSAAAQDKEVKKPTKEPPKGTEPAPIVIQGQLPRGWAKLGLSASQKKEILTTRAKFTVRRQTLEEQLKALKAEEMTALEKILTEGQRQRLREVKK